MSTIYYSFIEYLKGNLQAVSKTYAIYLALGLLGYFLYVHPRLLRFLEQKNRVTRSEVREAQDAKKVPKVPKTQKDSSGVYHVPVESPGGGGGSEEGRRSKND